MKTPYVATGCLLFLVFVAFYVLTPRRAAREEATSAAETPSAPAPEVAGTSAASLPAALPNSPGEAAPAAPRSGSQTARADLAAGRARYLLLGPVSPETAVWRDLLRTKFGLTAQEIKGTPDDRALQKFVLEYNKVIKDHLNRTHGASAFQNSLDEAFLLHQQTKAAPRP